MRYLGRIQNRLFARASKLRNAHGPRFGRPARERIGMMGNSPMSGSSDLLGDRFWPFTDHLF